MTPERTALLERRITDEELSNIRPLYAETYPVRPLLNELDALRVEAAALRDGTGMTKLAAQRNEACADRDRLAGEVEEWKQLDVLRCDELFGLREDHGNALIERDRLRAEVAALSDALGKLCVLVERYVYADADDPAPPITDLQESAAEAAKILRPYIEARAALADKQGNP